MSTWTITAAGETRPLAEWDVGEASVNYRNLDADTLSLEILRAPRAPIPFGPGRRIQLRKEGVPVFTGRLDEWSESAEADGESVTVTAAGPWWYLENLVYRQPYATFADDDVAAGGALLSRVVLGTGPSGAPATVADAIADVLAYAASQGAPIEPAPISADLDEPAPISTAQDITCAEAIRRILLWEPGVVVWFDYAGAASDCPVLRLRRQCDLCVTRLTAGEPPLASWSLAPSARRPAGVDILYILPVDTRGRPAGADGEGDGEVLRAVEVDSFPPQEECGAFGRLTATIDLTDDPGSPRPAGLARRYWESFPDTPFSGDITLAYGEAGGPWLGRAVAIDGDRAGYAKPIPVQSAAVDVVSATVRLAVGWPDHLSADDFLERQRRFSQAFRRG